MFYLEGSLKIASQNSNLRRLTSGESFFCYCEELSPLCHSEQLSSSVIARELDEAISHINDTNE